MIPLWYFYSFWCWIWTVLYFFDYIKISPFFSTLGCIIFTTWNVLFSGHSHKFPLYYKKFIM